MPDLNRRQKLEDMQARLSDHVFLEIRDFTRFPMVVDDGYIIYTQQGQSPQISYAASPKLVESKEDLFGSIPPSANLMGLAAKNISTPINGEDWE